MGIYPINQLILDLREDSQLILHLDGAQFAMHLGAEQFTLEATATPIDLGHDEAALAGQIPVPVHMEAFCYQL